MVRPIEISANFPIDVDKPFDGYVYSRINNPNVAALEEKIAKLEEGKFCLAFSSGMSAITTLFWTLLGPNSHVVASDDCYTGTYSFCLGLMKQWGVETTFIDHRNPQNIKNAIKKNTRLVFIETPSNPMLYLCDLFETREIIKNENSARVFPILFAVDNTFATPLLQKPLELGADFVIHSTTKAINGHSTAVGGAIITNNYDWQELLFSNRTILGTIQQPTNAYWTEIGLKTLEVRTARQCETAKMLAEWLEQQSEIEYVLYPGLESFPQKALADKQMKAGGTIISFAVKGNLKTAQKFLKTLKIMTAVSLGAVDSYIEIPYTMSHHDVSLGRIPENLIRFSVGLESFEELKEDLKRGLQTV